MSAQQPSEDDIPTMSELAGVRYLHLGTEWVQGAMRVRRPDQLVLAYAQQMMAWLLFLEPEKDSHVGILGLGAGSLLRYTLAHTPAQVDTAEWNPGVTAICRAYFRLPESPRSHIEHIDAQLWIEQPGNIGRYMALMVDLYDASAQGPVRESLEFYTGCYQSLGDAGVMTVNLFGDHASFPRNMANIRAAFGGRVLELPEVDAGNRVVLAFKGPVLQVSTAVFLERAAHVESCYKLPARRWARHLLSLRPEGLSI
ncbi:spermidine synthase [Eoetvoesiella caeni]|uniref:Spermidine synthase n=1 Tax=Eoetvoesiella caeni TaxID=645616 RepID=A0A366HJP1_9BURK|nr:spermidine synthase [Eoetvoesiella caeni]MCI2807518.1 spermidine synthase [Eoetvoesiella caeni]NYT53087.1 spermidine synthase [Eoetvoesiella caeni]RBP43064.1 spermidine synthase [Eoetvoesiella caeni]